MQYSSPSASLDFVGYGGFELNAQLTSLLERILLHSNAISLENLCLIPSKKCWIVYIDVVVSTEFLWFEIFF